MLLLIGLISYSLMIGPFTSYMRNKPIVEKLGYIPSVKWLKPLSVDQKEFTGASLVFKVMMYYGKMVGLSQQGLSAPQLIDLQGMSRLLHQAVQLDPYNMDAYYLAQGFLTWDAGQIKVANDLLDYGMKYRDWDWQLPYFAGFNYAYFLKDYKNAMKYYKKTGELSGYALHINLAGRYMQESGQTDHAIAYLTAMEKRERNPVIKRGYQIRLQAFREVRRIELARDNYKNILGTMPVSVEQLVQAGMLNPSPVDPYGGRFYLETGGTVATTSKYAFAVTKGEKKNVGN